MHARFLWPEQLREGCIPIDTECIEEDLALVDAWVLAGKYQLEELQRPIEDLVFKISKGKQTISAAVCRYVYQHTSIGSTLREVYVALVATSYNVRDFVEEDVDGNGFPRELLMSLSASLMGEFYDDLRGTNPKLFTVRGNR